MNKTKKLMLEFINDICEKNYAHAKVNLEAIVDEKIKDRIRNQAQNKD